MFIYTFGEEGILISLLKTLNRKKKFSFDLYLTW